MSNILNSLFSRYAFSRKQGVHNSEYIFTCNTCDQKVLSSSFAEKEYTWRNKPDPREAELAAHIATHGILPCVHCGCYMTRRGMKNHQNSVDCQSAARRYAMRKRGFEVVSLDNLEGALEAKLETIRSELEWDDHKSFSLLTRECNDAHEWFLGKLGVVTAYSEHGPIYTTTSHNMTVRCGKDWKPELWAPKLHAEYLKLLNESLNTAPHDQYQDRFDNYLLELSRFAETDNKEAALGLLELSLDEAA